MGLDAPGPGSGRPVRAAATGHFGDILSADAVTFGHASTQVPRGLAHSAAFAITRRTLSSW
jgi:hypothetical protein